MSASKDFSIPTTTPQDTRSHGNEVYNNNLHFTQSPESSIQRRYTIYFTFKSGTRAYSKEILTTTYQYKKLAFLMTSTKAKYAFREILQRSQTDVDLGNTSFCLTVEFITKYHEDDFERWVESCLETTDQCVCDLELLLMKGTSNDLHKIEKEVQKSQLVKDGALSVFPMKGIDGLFLLSSVDYLISMILELQNQLHNISFWSPESEEEVKLNVLHMTSLQCRLNAIFKGTEQMKTLFPKLKIRFNENETSLEILGNQNDISAATAYFDHFVWMEGVPRNCCQWAEGFQSYFARDNVQSFIDKNITTQDATWIIDRHGKHADSLVVFGKTERDVNVILNVLKESIRKMEWFVRNTTELGNCAKEWNIKAVELEEKYKGKFIFNIGPFKCLRFLRVTIIVTADLENEALLKMLVQEVELQSIRTERLTKSKKHLVWLQKCYLDALGAEAKKLDLSLMFTEDKSSIQLEGTSTALKEMKKFINSICMEERHIHLPFKAFPLKVINFFSECRCCYDYTDPENSRFWIKGKIGIIASRCQSGLDHIYVQVSTKLGNGKYKDSDVESFNESGIFLKCAYFDSGVGSDVVLLDEGLKLLLSALKESNKMPIAFEIQDLSFNLVHVFLKSIVDLVPELPDGLIILLHLLDEAMFQTTVEYLQKTEPCLTEGLVKGHRYQKKQIDLLVLEGKIAELPNEVDVIVNTTSRNLDMTRGAVSKAILEAAGDELKNEIAKTPVIKQGSQRIRVEYGDIVETFGYRLKCQRIFHGTLYKWTDDQSKSLDILQRFVKNCISLADDRKFKTLAFPAIGTGRLQIPPDVVATCVKRVVEEYSLSHPQTSVEKLIFVIYEKDIANLQVFKDILEKKAGVVDKEVPPTLYQVSVYGKMHNIVGVMNVLLGLLQKYIIKSKGEFPNQKKIRASDDQKNEEKNHHLQANTNTDVHSDRETINEESNLSKNISKVIDAAGLSENENQSAPDDDDEKCLLMESKSNMALSDLEETLGPSLKDVACDVVCPFLNEFCALIRFKTIKDADTFLGSFANKNMDVQKFPRQEVKDTKAKLGPKVINVLEKRILSSEEFHKKTGGTLCIQTWTVSGNLLVLQHVQKFLKDLVEEFERPKTPKTENVEDYEWWMQW